MTFRCDPTTRAELDAKADKQQWGVGLNAALGNSRTITCKRNPDGGLAHVDVWAHANSVIFRKTNSTGALKIVAGKVVGFGRIKGTTVSQAADVATGKSVLRIEGNGRWIEVTLGIAGSGADVIANGYFTATNGLALKPDFALSGAVFLPSGTGPAAPALDADAPVAFRVLDYSNPASPIIAGTAQMNVRDLDMVMDHPQIASEMGDVRIQRCADGAGVVLGTAGDCFRFAGMVMSMNAANNQDDPTKPVHQVLINCAPHNRWPSYPFAKDMNRLEDTTIPPPFKIELLRADGSVLHIFELYSTQTNDAPGTGHAINSAAGHDRPFGYSPVRPHWTCFQMLKWQNHKIKENTKALHYLPGVEADALHPSNTTAFDADIQCWPLITGRYTANGLNTVRLAPKWSRGGGAGAFAFDTAIVDTNHSQPSRDDYVTQIIGYGYEPGSNGGHTWYMSPGGTRNDRGSWPHTLVRWASDPTGSRIHGNVPNVVLKDHWIDCYMNEGMHYFPAATLERFISLDKVKLSKGELCYNGTYYAGGNENFVPDTLNNNINLLAAQNASDSGPLDKYGRRFNNEYQRDNQHSNSSAAVGVYLNNSPAHVISARASFNSHVLCNWGMMQGSFNYEEWLTRQHAWDCWQRVNMWVAASSDERSMSRDEVEAMWENHLHAVHAAVMPRFLSGTDTWSIGMRNTGLGVRYKNDGINHGYGAYESDSKMGYMGQALLLMKQSGAWAAMRARSVKCQEILDLLVRSLAKATVDCFLDGNGRVDNTSYDEARVPVGTPLGDPTWANTPPPKGLQDWLRDEAGNLTDANNSYVERVFNTMHYRSQSLWIIERFFPEIAHPRLAEAVTKVNGYYDLIEQRRLAGTGTQWHYRFAMMGKFKAPAVLGAPTVGV